MQRTLSIRERIGTLRVRILIASGCALLSLATVVGVTLHQVFEYQAREDLRTRTRLLAGGASSALARAAYAPSHEADAIEIALRREFFSLNSWLESDPDFESVHVLDDAGRRLLSFPDRDDPSGASAGRRFLPPPGETKLVEGSTATFAIVPLEVSAGRARAVEVRCSTKRLHADLLGIRWLFASIFLLAGAVFSALAIYLTRGVVHPLDEVRRAAHRLASGEANVRIPISGDREIDVIAHFLHSIAERRFTAGANGRTDPAPGPPRTDAFRGAAPRADVETPRSAA